MFCGGLHFAATGGDGLFVVLIVHGLVNGLGWCVRAANMVTYLLLKYLEVGWRHTPLTASYVSISMVRRAFLLAWPDQLAECDVACIGRLVRWVPVSLVTALGQYMPIAVILPSASGICFVCCIGWPSIKATALRDANICAKSMRQVAHR